MALVYYTTQSMSIGIGIVFDLPTEANREGAGSSSYLCQKSVVSEMEMAKDND